MRTTPITAMESLSGIHSLEQAKRHDGDTLIPTGTHCSDYKAEATALEQVAPLVKKSPDTATRQIVFLTDCFPNIPKPKSATHAHLSKLFIDIAKLSSRRALQWIPGHYQIPGNEARIHSQNRKTQCYKTQQKRPLKRRRHTSRQQSGR
ncbi:hypothetical protein PoB_005229200 [Plakobranchus ocellatus]|uniref:RNase H type-1 domain-containing protein n=1 Tax=Plakobranchus ocellatus TaxID=259542 RepID=A0AAV4C3G8_9GAST|nr:hypothetical protein PoB_005229200 [Plakobranchus ocellatus]